MLAVKKLSTNFTFLNCLKMGLFFSWNVDDSEQSGGPKDRVPDPRTAQTGVQSTASSGATPTGAE